MAEYSKSFIVTDTLELKKWVLLINMFPGDLAPLVTSQAPYIYTRPDSEG